MEEALVLCEGYLGESVGKTANGLVRYSARYEIVGVVDGTHAGCDAGEVLDGTRRNIPVYGTVREALEASHGRVKWAIVGVATPGGYLPESVRPSVMQAVGEGLNVVSGLHEYLSEDPEIAALADETGAEVLDIRRPKPLKELRFFSDACKDIGALRIPFLGTDGSIGKRTAAILLTQALEETGVRTAFVATGQTGLLQGARFGVPLDAIRGDFMVGELEGEILRAYEEDRPQVIVIEGQGSISHPAYVCGTRAVITASRPSALMVQHAPGRRYRNYRKAELKLPMPSLEADIGLLETFSGAPVIGVGLNHEGLSTEDVEAKAEEYRKALGIPVCDPLLHGCGVLAEAVAERLG
jgi:uncharacterized NAD-dependent epimerase/dehydratase family protein